MASSTRVQVFPLQVFHQGKLHRLGVCQLFHQRGYFFQPRKAGRAPAALAGHNHIPAAGPGAPQWAAAHHVRQCCLPNRSKPAAQSSFGAGLYPALFQKGAACLPLRPCPKAVLTAETARWPLAQGRRVLETYYHLSLLFLISSAARKA